MNKPSSSSAITTYHIHPATRVGTVSLTVSNLAEQMAFYRQVLGLQLHWQDKQQAGLGAGTEDLLLLVEQPGSQLYKNTTGLYHFAIVYPDRRELARAVARLFALRYKNYPTDHIMTKTTYLEDPEGNGIELYTESPEDGVFTIENDEFVTRRADGSLSDGREPLDVEALFSHLQEDDRLDKPISPQAHMGHVHLHVRDVKEALDFYHGILGFDLQGYSTIFQAAFISAGGYHHHIGLNAWKGNGAPPAPAGARGLRYFTVVLPDRQSMDGITARLENSGIAYNRLGDELLLSDPSQNGVMLKVED